VPVPYLSPNQTKALLIVITIPEQGVLRFQNYQPEDYFYQGEPYSFIEFDGGGIAGNSLGLGSAGRSVRIVNTDAKIDAIRPVRDWLNQYNGWRDAEVEIIEIWPDDLSAQPRQERHRIFKSDIGKDVGITLKDPANAINANAPSQYLTPRIAPELPNVAPS